MHCGFYCGQQGTWVDRACRVDQAAPRLEQRDSCIQHLPLVLSRPQQAGQVCCLLQPRRQPQGAAGRIQQDVGKALWREWLQSNALVRNKTKGTKAVDRKQIMLHGAKNPLPQSLTVLGSNGSV